MVAAVINQTRESDTRVLGVCRAAKGCAKNGEKYAPVEWLRGGRLH